VQSVFHNVGHDDGQFGDLMPQGIGVAAGQGLAAAPTGGGHAGDDLPHLLGRDE